MCGRHGRCFRGIRDGGRWSLRSNPPSPSRLGPLRTKGNLEQSAGEILTRVSSLVVGRPSK